MVIARLSRLYLLLLAAVAAGLAAELLKECLERLGLSEPLGDQALDKLSLIHI